MTETETTYTIVRFYANPHRYETVAIGVTLAEAQAHCSDPETSSRTCTTAEGQARTAERGDWFEGYREETR